MQGKLIASVLVPAQTPPQRKKLSEQEQATASGILLGFALLFAVAVAISVRRSAHAAKTKYSTFSARRLRTWISNTYEQRRINLRA